MKRARIAPTLICGAKKSEAGSTPRASPGVLSRDELCALLRQHRHSFHAAGVTTEYNCLMRRLDPEHLASLAQGRAMAVKQTRDEDMEGRGQGRGQDQGGAGRQTVLKPYQALSEASYVCVTNAWVQREDAFEDKYTLEPTCKACIKWYKRHGKFRAQKRGARHHRE